jgi:hypothetical protein
MRSIGSWRVSTWLIVVWSVLFGYIAAVLVAALVSVSATSCAGNTNSVTPTCQDWANLFVGVLLFCVILVWLVGLVVLVLVWATGRPDGGQGSPFHLRPRRGTPQGACSACGARVTDVREVCPRCGHSPQDGLDPWESSK